jgi:hypothetical protein
VKSGTGWPGGRIAPAHPSALNSSPVGPSLPREASVAPITAATAHSENARVVERYTPVTEGGLQRMRVEVTIHDPEFYTSPPTITRQYTRLVEGRMLDYDCTEPDWEDHLEKLREQHRKK